VFAATQPIDQEEDHYYYYIPYWTMKGLLLPFEVGGPWVGWQGARPRLPFEVDEAAQDLWNLSEKLVDEWEKKGK